MKIGTYIATSVGSWNVGAQSSRLNVLIIEQL